MLLPYAQHHDHCNFLCYIFLFDLRLIGVDYVDLGSTQQSYAFSYPCVGSLLSRVPSEP